MATFHPFPKLPPELRFQIWEIALAEWSLISFRRFRKRIKITGRASHKNIAQSCHEARQIMCTKFVQINRLGWFHFSRTMFFFRDIGPIQGSMQRITTSNELFQHIEHICINTRDQPLLLDTVKFLMEKCTSLRTLVIVAPWLIPVEGDQYDQQVDWVIRNEHWTRTFTMSPTELDQRAIASLLEAVEHGSDENEAGLQRYRSRLDQAVRRVPDERPSYLTLNGHFAWRINRTLNMIKDLIEGSVMSPKPKLYLRSFEEIRGMVPDGSRYWSH